VKVPKLFKEISKGVALPPGVIVETDELRTQEAEITVFDYTEEVYEEKKIKDIKECFPYKDKPSVTWVNIEGMNLDVIHQIDNHFGIHPLVAEDIVVTGQRAKVEDYEDYIFIVIKMIYMKSAEEQTYSEQISLILGPNYVISFQEKIGGDVFGPIRDRIRTAKGRVRKMGADYLAYCLLDAVVDNYFAILEKKGEEMDVLESRLMADGRPEFFLAIHQHKRDMGFLRKQIWPLREVLSALQRSESRLIKKTTSVYLRDVYDHAVQVIDTIESFRDILAGMRDMHMTMISNKMNEVMKVLTVIATIFIPLTFMTGIYGMNFDYMPELRWRGSYFFLLFCMAVVAGGMVVYFRRRDWL
jgi:magnesium transporter